jgi:hypothetical protein
MPAAAAPAGSRARLKPGGGAKLGKTRCVAAAVTSLLRPVWHRTFFRIFSCVASMLLFGPARWLKIQSTRWSCGQFQTVAAARARWSSLSR